MPARQDCSVRPISTKDYYLQRAILLAGITPTVEPFFDDFLLKGAPTGTVTASDPTSGVALAANKNHSLLFQTAPSANTYAGYDPLDTLEQWLSGGPRGADPFYCACKVQWTTVTAANELRMAMYDAPVSNIIELGYSGPSHATNVVLKCGAEVADSGVAVASNGGVHVLELYKKPSGSLLYACVDEKPVAAPVSIPASWTGPGHWVLSIKNNATASARGMYCDWVMAVSNRS